MKSISKLISEAGAKVEFAKSASESYSAIQEEFDETKLDEIINASELKNKALKQAIKAVKDLYVLFGFDAPTMKYLMNVESEYLKIARRWEYMNESVREWITF